MNVTLTLMTKDGAKRDFQLPSTVTVIGRRQDCDLCIPLMNVSRRHCEINQDEGQLKIRDLGSRNGTYLNGNKIDEISVNPGDHLSVGPLEFTIDYTLNHYNNDSSSIASAPDDVKKAEKQQISSQFLKEEGAYDKAAGSNDTEIMEGFSQ